MIVRNDAIKICRIVKKLELRRFTFGNEFTWHWRRPFFRHYLELKYRINPHITIVGESGSGKSNACKAIIKAVCRKGMNVIIFDPHSEYLGIADPIKANVYDAAYDGINIFDLDNMSEREKTGELTDMFRHYFRLGHVQSSVLYKALSYTYDVFKAKGRMPTLHDLLFTLKVFKRHATPTESRTLETLGERLSMIDNGAFTRNTNIGEVMSANSIFILSGLHTNEAQAVYMEGAIRKIYSLMLSGSRHDYTKTYLIIDEAEKLGESPMLGRMAAEGRKYGIGIITISQKAKSIDSSIRGNSSLFLSFYQREPEELNYIANFIAGGNELNRFVEAKKGIRNLKKGEAVMLDSNEKEPFIVRFEEFKGSQISLAFKIVELSKYAIKEETLFEKLHGFGFEDNVIEERIAELSRKGRVSSYSISNEINPKGIWYISMRRNSAEHDIFVNIICRRMNECGIRGVVYNNSYGPDVIAYIKGRRFAIEYETGSKEIERVRQMVEYRKKGYERVVMIVNDSFYERYAAINGVSLFSVSSFFSQNMHEILS